MKKKQQRGVGDTIESDDLVANLLLNLKQQPPSSDNNTSTLSPPPTITTTNTTAAATPSMLNPAPPSATANLGHQSTQPKVVGSTTTCSNCNVSRKRKLDEVDHGSTPAEVLAHRAMSDEDLSSTVSLLLVKLSCLTPELLSRFEGSLKVAQRKSKRVERYKKKLADKDEEIRQLKDEVKNLKKIAKKNKHQSEVTVLKTCLQEVQTQLEYKDGLLVEAVTELDSLEESLVGERDCHLAKEQLWVEEKRSVDMTVLNLKMCLQDVQAQLEYKDRLLVEGVTELDSLQRRVEELLVNNKTLEDDRKWLISEGFSHAIKYVLRSDGFVQPYEKYVDYIGFCRFQHGLKVGYQNFTLGVPLEKLDFYRPGILDKYKLVKKSLTNLRYPYVEKLSRMVDQPLDVIRDLKPERKVVPGATKNGTPTDFANRVDKYLQQLE